MLSTRGRKRVVIKNISPCVEEGKYAAKGTVSEEIVLSADIFCDGHDEIEASVFIKHKKERRWREFPMQPVSNDRWEYIFLPAETGVYEFRFMGWINPFRTWRRDLLKKYEAGMDIRMEQQTGADIMDRAAAAQTKAMQARLRKWIHALRHASLPSELILIAEEDKLNAVLRNFREKERTTMHPQVFVVEVERTKASFSAWYELFPRSCAAEPGRHGSFRDVIRLLPRIAAMGFDTLYLPPIHPIGEQRRKGKNNALTAGDDDPGSPWAIGSRHGGHKSIHPQLGTADDFRRLIAEAKKLGIEIAMDIAFQCAPDHPYVKEHPQWFRWRPDGTVQYAENPPKRYEDILPFHFETEDWEPLWAELKSIVEYWIGQGVTMFRVDNPHTKPFAFWEWMIAGVRRKHPEVIFLAEAFTRPRVMEQLAMAGFSQSYTYFTWRNTKQEIQEYMAELTAAGRRYYFRPSFWPNTPDILPPFLTQGGEAAHLVRFLLAATLVSGYGIYGPVFEFGYAEPMPGKEEYMDNEKYEIRHWDWDRYTRIREIIALVNRIRKENTAFHTTWNVTFAPTTNDRIICYIKRDKRTGNTCIIAVNLDPHQVQSGSADILNEQLGLPPGQPYAVHDLLSGDRYIWKHGWNHISLSPLMPAHILKTENPE